MGVPLLGGGKGAGLVAWDSAEAGQARMCVGMRDNYVHEVVQAGRGMVYGTGSIALAGYSTAHGQRRLSCAWACLREFKLHGRTRCLCRNPSLCFAAQDLFDKGYTRLGGLVVGLMLGHYIPTYIMLLQAANQVSQQMMAVDSPICVWRRQGVAKLPCTLCVGVLLGWLHGAGRSAGAGQ